jgi:hypothetical protein
MERSEDLDRNAVRDLASASDGDLVLAKLISDDDGASLAQAFSTIGKQLGDSYDIGIIAPAAQQPMLVMANAAGGTLHASLISRHIIAQASPAEAVSQAHCAPRKPTPSKITSLPGYA